MDRVTFEIGQPSEASVRADLRVQFDRDARFAKPGDRAKSRARGRLVLHFDRSGGTLLSKYKR